MSFTSSVSSVSTATTYGQDPSILTLMRDTQFQRADMLESEINSILASLNGPVQLTTQYRSLQTQLQAFVDSGDASLFIPSLGPAELQAKIDALQSVKQGLEIAKSRMSPTIVGVQSPLFGYQTGISFGGMPPRVSLNFAPGEFEKYQNEEAPLRAQLAAAGFSFSGMSEIDVSKEAGSPASYKVFQSDYPTIVANIDAVSAKIAEYQAALQKPNLESLGNAGVNLALATPAPGGATIDSATAQTWIGQLDTAISLVNKSIPPKDTARLTTLQEKWKEAFALITDVTKRWMDNMQSLLSGIR